MPTGIEEQTSAAPKKAGAALLKATRIKPADILSTSEDGRTIVTRQGGKYSLSEDGKQVVRLAGPVPAGLQPDAERQEAERQEKAENAGLRD